MYYNYAFDVSSPALRFGTDKSDVPELWQNKYDAYKKRNDDGHGEHIQHPLVVGETLFGDSRAFHLRTGKLLPIKFPERRGCGNMAASNHSMFFRHYFHGMWDLKTNTKSEFKCYKRCNSIAYIWNVFTFFIYWKSYKKIWS